MPRVPQYERAVTSDPMPVTQAPPLASPSDAGIAVWNALRQTSANMVNQTLREREEANTAEALQFDNSAAEQENALLWGDQGALRSEGLSAGPASKKALEEWDRSAESLIAKASSPAVKRATQAMLLRRRQAISETLSRHTAGQEKQALVSESEATKDNAIREVSNDPSRIGTALETGRRAIAARARLESWSAEEINAADAAFTSKAHLAAVDRFVELEDFDSAFSYLDAHGEEIDSGKRGDLRQKIERQALPTRVENATTDLWERSGADYSKASVLLEKVDPELRDDVRKSLNARKQVQDEVRSEERQELVTEAYQVMLKTGSYAGMTATPVGRALQRRLAEYPDLNESLRNISDNWEADARADGRDSNPSRDLEAARTMEAATNFAMDSPEEFMKLPLVDSYGDRLKKDDLEQLIGIQHRMKKSVKLGNGPFGDPEVSSSLTLSQKLSAAIEGVGMKPGSSRAKRAQAAIMRQIATEEADGKKIAPDRLTKIIDDKLLVEYGMFGWSRSYAFEREESMSSAMQQATGTKTEKPVFSVITPPDIAEQIRARARETRQLELDPAQVDEIYLRGKSK